MHSPNPTAPAQTLELKDTQAAQRFLQPSTAKPPPHPTLQALDLKNMQVISQVLAQSVAMDFYSRWAACLLVDAFLRGQMFGMGVGCCEYVLQRPWASAPGEKRGWGVHMHGFMWLHFVSGLLLRGKLGGTQPCTCPVAWPQNSSCACPSNDALQPRGAHAGDLLQHEPGDAGDAEHWQDQQAGGEGAPAPGILTSKHHELTKSQNIGKINKQRGWSGWEPAAVGSSGHCRRNRWQDHHARFLPVRSPSTLPVGLWPASIRLSGPAAAGC